MSPPEELCSIPAWRFQRDSDALLNFMYAKIKYARELDEMKRIFAQLIVILASSSSTPAPPLAEKAARAVLSGEACSTVSALQEFQPLESELVFCRMIDNFLNYISELLAMIFGSHPEMLKSDEKVSVDWVIQYLDRDELLSALTERRVLDLSFKGMFKLNEELNRRYAFQLFERKDDLEQAVVLVEKRNLIAHNRGEVNRRYLERMPGASEKRGDRLVFEAGDVIDDLTFLITRVAEIDKRAGDKFGVARNEKSWKFLAPSFFERCAADSATESTGKVKPPSGP